MIGAQLGISAETAWRDVKRAIKYVLGDAVEEIISLEQLRLDEMLLGLRPRPAEGKNPAERWTPDKVTAALKIMERRAKLLGLDAPERHTVEAEGATIGGTFKAIIKSEALRDRYFLLLEEAAQVNEDHTGHSLSLAGWSGNGGNGEVLEADASLEDDDEEAS